MDNTTTRLTNCFKTVFPDVGETQILSATQESVAAWDSIATITLVNVVEDEFGIQMDIDQLETFDSFEGIRKYILQETR
jgi:acyl carrier protein